MRLSLPIVPAETLFTRLIDGEEDPRRRFSLPTCGTGGLSKGASACLTGQTIQSSSEVISP